ncbi:protein SNOWY COTYLEDON 3-like [Dendrobium catenatum]|uniref:protein SNOWY COTYLEDON 3-like n=1 Tax=Dendrobium catenatum TaxID=906689 RepID=UPI00109FA66A|nr:protein SNOWY COTYLEDON 3-like [Dendrobium catenatum]
MSSATIPRYSSSSSLLSSRHFPTIVNDYPPLELPLRWRDPPPKYPPLERPMRWRDPSPDCAVHNHPGAVFSDSYPSQHHPPPVSHDHSIQGEICSNLGSCGSAAVYDQTNSHERPTSSAPPPSPAVDSAINTLPDLTAPANNLSVAQIIHPHELPNPHNVISDPSIHFDSVVANLPLPHTKTEPPLSLSISSRDTNSAKQYHSVSANLNSAFRSTGCFSSIQLNVALVSTDRAEPQLDVDFNSTVDPKECNQSDIMQESGSSFAEEDSNSNTQHFDTFVPEAETSSDVHRRPTTAAESSAAANSDHSENLKALDHHHRWPVARSRQSSMLTKSLDCSAERNELKSTIQLLRQPVLLDVGSSRALFESAKLSASSDTDSVSSGSNSGTPELNVPQHVRVTSHGSSVSARFWQETNSRLRRQPEIGTLVSSVGSKSPSIQCGDATSTMSIQPLVQEVLDSGWVEAPMALAD